MDICIKMHHSISPCGPSSATGGIRAHPGSPYAQQKGSCRRHWAVTEGIKRYCLNLPNRSGEYRYRYGSAETYPTILLPGASIPSGLRPAPLFRKGSFLRQYPDLAVPRRSTKPLPPAGASPRPTRRAPISAGGPETKMNEV